MQIRNKLFPYPVLNQNSVFSNYLNCNFELVFEDESNEDFLILRNVGFKTNSLTINKLIEEDKIAIALIFECVDVIMRKCFDITKSNIDIKFSNQELSGKVELSLFAYAKTDFIYIPKEVDDDYLNIEFQIDKYDIIAANDGVSRNILHKDAEENLVKSIFSIQSLSSVEEGTFEVQYENSKKILISMSEYDYSNYKIVYSRPVFKEVFFNMILIPALTQALTQCFNEVKNNGTDIDDILVTYQWFSSIQKQYKRLKGVELTNEVILSIQQPISLSQEILGNPMKAALENLRNIRMEIEED